MPTYGIDVHPIHMDMVWNAHELSTMTPDQPIAMTLKYAHKTLWTTSR